MEALLEGFQNFTWQNGVMIIVGLVLIILAIKKEYEPMLILPIGFGCILVNLPLATVIENSIGQAGFLQVLYKAGITTELFPLLIFVGIGAMIDFSPLLKQPIMIFFGGCGTIRHICRHDARHLCKLYRAGYIHAQGKRRRSVSSVRRTGQQRYLWAIFLRRNISARYPWPHIRICRWWPIIQPPVIRALTTKHERRIRMESDFNKKVSRPVLIAFPIIVTLVVGFVAPEGVPLVGALMFGNLIRGVRRAGEAVQIGAERAGQPGDAAAGYYHRVVHGGQRVHTMGYAVDPAYRFSGVCVRHGGRRAVRPN